jgi:hypothetical protein
MAISPPTRAIQMTRTVPRRESAAINARQQPTHQALFLAPIWIARPPVAPSVGRPPPDTVASACPGAQLLGLPGTERDQQGRVSGKLAAHRSRRDETG